MSRGPEGRLNWGILSTAKIAINFTKGVRGSRTGNVYAVASRSADKAAAFAREHSVPRAYGSYEELLADPQVDVIYVATPHPMHAEWCIQAARAGKHILCEKPITLNAADAMRVIEEARRNDVFFMEAFMYRLAPQTRRVIDLIRQGAIGEVRLIRATFSFQGPDDPRHRLLDPALGGGGILDVGCYTVSAARLLAGVATGGEFAEPLSLTGHAQIGPTGVDEWAIATAEFPGGILAQLSAGISLQQDNQLVAFGTEGRIVVPWPWIPARDGGSTVIELHRRGQEPETISVQSDLLLYAYEVDAVAEGIPRRQALFPAMTWDDTIGNMKTLDLWRRSIGLVYEAEKSR